MKIEVERSCLDCNFASGQDKDIKIVCSYRVPRWASQTGQHGEILRAIDPDQPYINCPAWEGKEGEDD